MTLPEDPTQKALAITAQTAPTVQVPTIGRNTTGRPAGTINKLTGADLLAQLNTQIGRPYAEQLAINYKEAIDGGDKTVVQKYDQLILNKVISDRIDVAVGDRDEAIQAKQAAFMAALSVAGQRYKEQQQQTIDVARELGEDQDSETD